MDNSSLAHTKWNCKYHIVFAPKYRRRIIYGTLITPGNATRIKELGVNCVSIRLDGLQEVNDAFRDSSGAYDRTLASFRNCHAAG